MQEQQNAGTLCNREVKTAYRKDDLSTAARRMREHHVGSLVVVDEADGQRRPVGMLTDRDIVTAAVAHGIHPSTLCVEDVMSQRLVTAREDDSIIELLHTMRSHGLRRLPVLDAQDQLVGLVARDDLIDEITRSLSMAVAVVPASKNREQQQRASGSGPLRPAATSRRKTVASATRPQPSASR